MTHPYRRIVELVLVTRGSTETLARFQLSSVVVVV